MIRSQIDRRRVADLMRAVAQQDAAEFGAQHPAYRDNIEGETQRAITHLKTAPANRGGYDSFMAAVVYGEAATLKGAIETVEAFVDQAWP